MSVTKFLKKAKEIEEAHEHKKEDVKHSADHDESNWLVSYADMMTLLCGFFIMLFSMSKLDEPKYEKVKEAVSKQFGGEYKSPHEDLTKFVTQVIQEAGVDKNAVIKSDPRGVTLSFSSTVFFDSLSADIRPAGQEVLNKLVESLAKEQQTEKKMYKIVVEGHTDSRPILSGPFPSNWELSGSRASSVVRMFLGKGFQGTQLTAIGYADTHPEAEAKNTDGSWNEEALTKNRRVVIRVLDSKVDSIPFPDDVAVYGPAPDEARSPAATVETGVPVIAPVSPPLEPSLSPSISSEIEAPASSHSR